MHEDEATLLERKRKELEHTEWALKSGSPAQKDWASYRIARLRALVAELEATPMQRRFEDLEDARQGSLGL